MIALFGPKFIVLNCLAGSDLTNNGQDLPRTGGERNIRQCIAL